MGAMCAGGGGGGGEHPGIVVAFDPEHPLLSTYNKNYQCVVTSIVFWKTKVLQVNFDVTGDNSLGPLQQPDKSELVYLPIGGAAPTYHVPVKIALQINTPNRISGSLTYHLKVLPKKDGSLHFRFGNTPEPGYKCYSTAELCRFVPQFIEQNGLGQLFRIE